MKVGIDFGTCTTSMCVDYNGKKQLLKCGTGSSATEFFIPSAVYLEENGNLLVGQAAEQSKMRNPQCFVKGFKRNLGEKIPLRLGEKDYLPEQLIQEILIYMKRTVQESEMIGEESIEEVTLCHPANFSDNKKNLLKKAALNAGFKKVNLLNEPTAAAYYYNSIGKISTGDNILVYDLGGGTFDVSIMKKTEEGLKILARPLGIEECGGNDFDVSVYEYLFEHSEDDLGQMIEQYPFNEKFMFTSMLEVKCVKAKEYLSTAEKAEIDYQYGFSFKHLVISRKDFEGLIEEYIEETISKVKEVIKNANLNADDVDKIILVGGSCRIPCIKKKLELELGEKVVKDVDPDWAVVYGATCQNDYEEIKATPQLDRDLRISKSIPDPVPDETTTELPRVNSIPKSNPTSADEVIRCPSCGTILDKETKFCHLCGCNIKKFSSNNDNETIYCNYCGTQAKKGDKFCVKCGKSFVTIFPTDEEIKLFRAPATMVRGIERINGTFIVTNKKIEFKPYVFHVKSKSIIIQGNVISRVFKDKERVMLLYCIGIQTIESKQFCFAFGVMFGSKALDTVNKLIHLEMDK